MENVFKQLSDIRIKKLIKKHGYTGFGVYNAMLQDMYNNDNCMTVDSEFLASEYEVLQQTIESILNDFNLFENSNGTYSSCLIAEILEKKNMKSSKARESIMVRWNKQREKLYERNTNVYERNTNVYERNTNVYERNTNVYERNTNVYENPENDPKNITTKQMCEGSTVQEANNDNAQNSFIAENHTKENKVKSKKPPISQREQDFINQTNQFVQYDKSMLDNFINYWCEKNPAGDKMKFEMQKTFEISKRLITWHNRETQNTFAQKQKSVFNRESDFN